MRLNIVYIDDDQDLCDIFVDLFEDKNIEIKTFTSIPSALENINNDPPDVVFIDYRLPGTTGDKVALKIKAAIPKFLITGDLSTETEYKFDKVFAKPYKASDVQAVLDEYLRKKRA